MMNRITNLCFLSRQIVLGIAIGIIIFPLCTPAWAAASTDAAESDAPPPPAASANDCFFVLMGDKKVDGPTAIMILGFGSAILHTIASSGLWGLSRLLQALRDPTQAKKKGVSDLDGTIAGFAVYYLLAAIAAAIILRFICHLELLEAIGLETHEVETFEFLRSGLGSEKIHKGDVDVFFTGLIMWLGAERVGHWLNIPGGPTPKTLQPVVISGDLQLKEPATPASE